MPICCINYFDLSSAMGFFFKGDFRKQYSLQACKTPSGPTQAAQTHNFKDSTSGLFR